MIFSRMIDSVIRFLENLEIAEKRIGQKIRRTKQEVLSLFILAVFSLLGLILILSGIIVLLARFFPIDVVLMVSGVLILYIVMIYRILKR